MSVLLDRFYAGPLKGMERKLLTWDQAPKTAWRATDLFSRRGMAHVIQHYGAEHQHGDCRAVMSLWSKYFLALTTYTGVAHNLLADRQLPLDLSRLGVVLGEDMLIDALVVEDTSTPLADTRAEARFLPLIHDTWGPAITCMAHNSGIAPRALWSNLGQYVDYLVGQLHTLPAAQHAAEAGEQLMTLRKLADGQRNPLFQPIRHCKNAEGDIEPIRRVCCIRYLLPGLGYCGNCPLACREKPETQSPRRVVNG
ncbi:ferric iron reductase protein FhuF [Chromohalobacter canadensis]|uniref:Ferric iron reductase protein FhuF n=1 Tax=Chromohalobacter canadensis TaxID=141389 RepID=A0A285VAT9_9GAMM|nr:siderophore-iron reductase FhuF [Chromohalobacter canadensis]SOC51242.1 ferric iron reductase protein FhuF [Chromohalobacter canadensis]